MSLHAFSLLFSTKILPLALALIAFGALIAIHEFGHFIFCKIFGIHTPTFSIGFGPELYRRQIGRTNFRLALIPFGGYCEIAGNEEIGQGEQEFARATGDDSFAVKPYWQKMLVLGGGIIFNLIFAYMVFCGLFMVGKSSNSQALVVLNVMKDSAAQKHGLRANDAIIQVNDVKIVNEQKTLVENAQELFLQQIKSNPNANVTLTVIRKDKTITLPIVLGSKQEGDKTVGFLGANSYEYAPIQINRLPFLQAIARGIQETNKIICTVVKTMKQLVVQRSLQGTGGPVMIMKFSYSSAQHGILALLVFLAFMSINLALFNLLPIGMLDGGQLLFTTIEAIIRRPLPTMLRMGINIISLILFVGLAVYMTYKDVSTLFGAKILGLWKKIGF